jgi:hypothetical protein
VPELVTQQFEPINSLVKRKHRVRRLTTLIGLGVVACVVVALATFGASGHGRSVGTTRPQRPGAAAPAVSSVSIPSQFDEVYAMIADPSGNGAWAWAADPGVEDAIFNVSSVGQVTTYAVLTGQHAVGPSGPTGLAVDGSGNVWLGLNNMLISLNPSTGAVTIAQLPTPSEDAASEQGLPPLLQGFHDTVSIASDPTTGDIAIAMSQADCVEIYAPTAGTFDLLPLPASTSPTGVAYADDGTLGVSLVDYNTHSYDEVVTFPPGSGAGAKSRGKVGLAKVAGVPDSLNIASVGDRFIVGLAKPTVLTVSEHAVRGTVQLTVQESSLFLGSLQAYLPNAFPRPLAVSATGELLGIDRASGDVMLGSAMHGDSFTSSRIVAVTGQMCYVGPPPKAGGGHKSGTPSRCGFPSLAAIDQSGRVYYVSQNAMTTIRWAT